MIAADTNLVVRHLTHDYARQAQVVEGLFNVAERRQEPVLLCHIVLCELCWVLKAAYEFDKARIVLALQSLLDDPGFHVERRPQVVEALALYRKHGGQFSDHLIGVVARDEGASTTYTFDQTAGKLPNFSRLR